jgi:hypothetical protein
VRYGHPFRADDLEELDEVFYAKAARVVAMEDVVAGAREANVIGLRHDCDAGHSLATAVSMAHWEAERGYRSTYFLLHTSPYWRYGWFPNAVQEIAECGHEIGIHTDALAESLVTGEDPDLILERAITRLRDLGYTIRGVVGHGNPICLRNRQPDESPFANDEQFAECRRPGHGEADRLLVRGKISRNLAPRPLADFGLEYEALWCAHPFAWRCSDSGGKWLNPGFEETAAIFDLHTTVDKAPKHPIDPRQLHLLIHPDWWSEAFVPVEAVA